MYLVSWLVGYLVNWLKTKNQKFKIKNYSFFCYSYVTMSFTAWGAGIQELKYKIGYNA